jgi:hypothetical protein
VQSVDDPYLTIIVLSRVITALGTLNAVTPREIENLFAADLAFLQDLYGVVNFGTADDVYAFLQGFFGHSVADEAEIVESTVKSVAKSASKPKTKTAAKSKTSAKTVDDDLDDDDDLDADDLDDDDDEESDEDVVVVAGRRRGGAIIEEVDKD